MRFADPPDSNDKHLPFFAREAEVADKLLVMNIRRLPVWILSAANHRAKHGVHPDYRPLPLETPDEMTEKTDPDDLLRWMTDHGRLSFDRWLRAEMLEKDTLTLLADLGLLNRRVERRILSIGRVNVGDYDRSPHERFTAGQIRGCCWRNPNWAEIELELYGNLLCDG